MDHPIFGYYKINPDPGSPALSSMLYPDGTLIFRTKDTESENWRDVTLQISEECTRRISDILDFHAMNLERYAKEINEANISFEEENYFLFKDQKIIDWDLARWCLEEEREKHPEYFKNIRKLELTENYVRAVFDQICKMIEQEPKEMRYMKSYYTNL